MCSLWIRLSEYVARMCTVHQCKTGEGPPGGISFRSWISLCIVSSFFPFLFPFFSFLPLINLPVFICLPKSSPFPPCPLTPLFLLSYPTTFLCYPDGQRFLFLSHFLVSLPPFKCLPFPVYFHVGRKVFPVCPWAPFVCSLIHSLGLCLELALVLLLLTISKVSSLFSVSCTNS